MSIITHTRPRTKHYDSPELVGARILEARENAGLSQRDLQFDGCSAAYLSRMERGERIGSLQVLTEIARRTGVSVDWLTHGRDLVEPSVAGAVKKVGEIAKCDDSTNQELANAYRALAKAANRAARTLS